MKKNCANMHNACFMRFLLVCIFFSDKHGFILHWYIFGMKQYAPCAQLQCTLCVEGGKLSKYVLCRDISAKYEWIMKECLHN